MKVDTRKLRDIQRKIAKEVSTAGELKLSEIKTVAGFDITYFDDKILCAAVVYDLEKKEIVEKTHTVSKQPMHYIPGYRAFRDGSAILQTYYGLELLVMNQTGRNRVHYLSGLLFKLLEKLFLNLA